MCDNSQEQEQMLLLLLLDWGGFPWTFIIASVTKPLLGLDFLSHNSLQWIANSKDYVTLTPHYEAINILNVHVTCETVNVSLSIHIPDNVPSELHALIHKFKDVFFRD